MMDSAGSWWNGRLWRLCQKELRETLRDRRTIVTLLLMPILVYPLLCIAMNRLLVAGAEKQGRPTYLIGVATEQEGAAIRDAIKAGIYWLQQRPYQPIRVHRYSNAAGAPEEEASVIGADRDVPEFDIRRVEGDAQKELEMGTIELVGVAEALKATSDLPNGLVPYRFRMSYRQDDGRSEAALWQFQRLLQVLIDVDDAKRAEALGKEPGAIVELKAEPIRIKDSSTKGLMTVIPLVLLLMTITGAVYPAIDLTAGERERGTMESLIASPVPRFALLLSKYVAVITVAMLTAVANLTSMWVTLSVTGIGEALLGNGGLKLTTLLLIFPLLLIFSCFFSAVLLALCSFAKSFKEAQAYLIPVMLVSLAPGVLSLMPGIEFTPLLAVVPLVNVILLSRDILTDSVSVELAIGAVVSTLIYAAAVLAIAAKLFGSDATQHAGQGSWSDWLRRPSHETLYPGIDHLFFYLASFFPIHFVVSNLVGQTASKAELHVGTTMALNAGVTFFLFVVLPWIYAVNRRLRIGSTFRLTNPTCRLPVAFLGVVLLSGCLWMVAHQLVVLSSFLGIMSLGDSQLEIAKKAKEGILELPLAYVILVAGVLPAIAEEFFFRGFVMSSLQKSLRPVWQVLLSGLIFGGFHVINGSVLSIERFMPATFLGIVLGWVAYRTGSLWPGILLHAMHNGLMFSLSFYEGWLTEHGWGIGDSDVLPVSYLATGVVLACLGSALVYFSRRSIPTPPDS